MDIVSKSEFALVEHADKFQFIRLTWLPACNSMSSIEFLQQIQLFAKVEQKYHPKIVFLDCYDFSFPILRNHYEFIIDKFSNVKFDIYAIIVSKDIVGKNSIYGFINQLIKPDTNISIFKSREDARMWYSDIFLEIINYIYN